MDKLIAISLLVFFGTCSIGGLFFLRMYLRNRKPLLVAMDRQPREQGKIDVEPVQVFADDNRRKSYCYTVKSLRITAIGDTKEQALNELLKLLKLHVSHKITVKDLTFKTKTLNSLWTL